MSTFQSKMLPFGGSRPSREDHLTPEMRQYALKIYREAWDAYKDVGCPYGKTDEAMLVWYSFRKNRDGDRVAMGKN